MESRKSLLKKQSIFKAVKKEFEKKIPYSQHSSISLEDGSTVVIWYFPTDDTVMMIHNDEHFIIPGIILNSLRDIFIDLAK